MNVISFGGCGYIGGDQSASKIKYLKEGQGGEFTKLLAGKINKILEKINSGNQVKTIKFVGPGKFVVETEVMKFQIDLTQSGTTTGSPGGIKGKVKAAAIAVAKQFNINPSTFEDEPYDSKNLEESSSSNPVYLGQMAGSQSTLTETKKDPNTPVPALRYGATLNQKKMNKRYQQYLAESKNDSKADQPSKLKAAIERVYKSYDGDEFLFISFLENLLIKIAGGEQAANKIIPILNKKAEGMKQLNSDVKKGNLSRSGHTDFV